MRTKLIVLIAALIGAVSVAAGAAVANGLELPFSADGSTVNGCYSSGGALKVLTPSNPTCPTGYSPLRWAATSSSGAAGGGFFYSNNDTFVALRQYATNDVAVVVLPVGSTYLVTGTTTVWNRMDHAVDVSCGISAVGAPFETTTVPAGGRASITVTSPSGPGGGNVLLDCATFQEPEPDVRATEAEISAVSVGSLTTMP